MRNAIAIIVFLLLFCCALWLIQKYSSPSRPAPAATSTVAPASIPALGERTKESGCQVQGPYPDKDCTPGAVFADATMEEVCVPGYSRNVRNVTAERKHEVYREYGIHHHNPGEYEVDHFVPLKIGGSNDIANLWPEAAEPRPGFHEKDVVEDYLIGQVCSGRMPLSQAQRAIASDWLKIYHDISGKQE